MVFIVDVRTGEQYADIPAKALKAERFDLHAKACCRKLDSTASALRKVYLIKREANGFQEKASFVEQMGAF